MLFRLDCKYLQSAKIMRPGVVSLMEHIGTVRRRAVGEGFGRVEHLLSGPRRAELDGLLAVEEGMSISRLAWLHRGATSASPMAIRGELDKLRYLCGLDAHRLDLSGLPEARRRRLAEVGHGRIQFADVKSKARVRLTGLVEHEPVEWGLLFVRDADRLPWTFYSRTPTTPRCSHPQRASSG